MATKITVTFEMDDEFDAATVVEAITKLVHEGERSLTHNEETLFDAVLNIELFKAE